MKAKELINLSKEELQDKIKGLKEELFKLNLKRYTGQIDKPHMYSAVKKDIARVETILNAKSRNKNG